MMDLCRYRINRANGKIFKEIEKNQLENIGNSFWIVILGASEPTYAKPFPHMGAQNWVQLCFLDSDGNWAYTLLNSGDTGALEPWLKYRQLLAELNYELWEVFTEVKIVESSSSNSDRKWYDYIFSAVPIKDKFPEYFLKIQRALAVSPYPFSDRSLPLTFEVPPPNKKIVFPLPAFEKKEKEMGMKEQEIAQRLDQLEF